MDGCVADEPPLQVVWKKNYEWMDELMVVVQVSSRPRWCGRRVLSVMMNGWSCCRWAPAPGGVKEGSWLNWWMDSCVAGEPLAQVYESKAVNEWMVVLQMNPCLRWCDRRAVNESINGWLCYRWAPAPGGVEEGQGPTGLLLHPPSQQAGDQDQPLAAASE